MNPKEIGWIRRMVYIWRNIRDKHSYNKGHNNKIIKRKGQIVGSRIQIVGDGNKVLLENRAMLLNSLIRITGNDNVVLLKANSFVSGAELWVENDRCELSIGERTFVGHHSHLACTEDGTLLSVGNDCMISSYVQVRTGDSHSIIDMEGNRINHALSVLIGDHCWIGEGSKVLKGVALEGDDIVSTGAIVTKSFGKNLLIGGVPAKVLKDNVNWKSDRI
jgi:acetyltransferase-like isoleucine patch superfamily enzyme